MPWCLLFVLPYAWFNLSVDDQLRLSYALHACDDVPVSAHQSWLVLRAQESRVDGLGQLVPVCAWPTADEAHICRDSLVRVQPDLPVQVACSDIEPAESWWNHTAVSPVIQTSWSSFIDDVGFAPAKEPLDVAYLHTAVALLILLITLWLLAWLPFSQANPIATPQNHFVAAPAADDESVETRGLVRFMHSDAPEQL